MEDLNFTFLIYIEDVRIPLVTCQLLLPGQLIGLHACSAALALLSYLVATATTFE